MQYGKSSRALCRRMSDEIPLRVRIPAGTNAVGHAQRLVIDYGAPGPWISDPEALLHACQTQPRTSPRNFGVGNIVSRTLKGIEGRIHMNCRCARIVPPLLGALFLFADCDALASEHTAERLHPATAAVHANSHRGARLYGRYCSQCHGVNGEGDGDRAVPAVAGQRFRYLVGRISRVEGLRTDRGTVNSPIANNHAFTPTLWFDIAAYVSRLPPPTGAKTDDGADEQLGGAIYREQCATCHASDARGDEGGFVPSLRNQHFSYLVNEMHLLAEGHRPNANQSLVLFMRSITEGDITAVAYYLSHLNGADSRLPRDN